MASINSCDKENTKIKKTTFLNPILKGFYPDPSICKVNDEFYMINSSFASFAGIAIFKSSNLLNWKQIGNALNRPEQLNLEGFEVSRGVFAPAITHN
jgi:alpha-N-arabinofuranosidase